MVDKEAKCHRVPCGDYIYKNEAEINTVPDFIFLFVLFYRDT